MISFKKILSVGAICLTAVPTYMTLFYADQIEIGTAFGALLVGWAIALMARMMPALVRSLAPSLAVSITYAIRLMSGGEPGSSVEDMTSVGIVFFSIFLLAWIAVVLLSKGRRAR